MTIAVFDSGMGGLTVLHALQDRLPSRDYVYLGDTARLPYGTKSTDTVHQYARRAAAFLMPFSPSALVIACNTASAAALDLLKEEFSALPVFGVIGPGARAAASGDGHILILATESTVASGAYPEAIRAIHPGASVTQIPCPLFVALAEAGWTDGPETEAVIRRTLLEGGISLPFSGTVLLGCTHFPVLRAAIQNVCGPDAVLVDSAQSLADDVCGRLAEDRGSGKIRFFVTDNPDRFFSIAPRFIGREIASEDTELCRI